MLKTANPKTTPPPSLPILFWAKAWNNTDEGVPEVVSGEGLDVLHLERVYVEIVQSQQRHGVLPSKIKTQHTCRNGQETT